jgi:tetratricopeptide (TPR) repeat protein
MSALEDLQQEAARLLAGGEIAAGIGRLGDIARLAPTAPEAWFNLAATLHNDGQRGGAARNFRRALLSDPGFVPALAHLTRHEAEASGPGAGLAQAWRLTTLVPFSAQALALTTQYLFELDRHEAAGEAARRSLVLEPIAAGLYRLMGLGAARLQRIETAETALRRACALQPHWADARLALAGAKFTRGDFEGCLREATRALADGGYRAEATFLQARAALALNRVEDADTFFAIAVAEEPARALDARIARLTLSRADFTHYHAY